MSVIKRFGFTFMDVPADSSVVRMYVIKHLVDTGYPLDIKPAAENWIGVVREGRVVGVFGFRKHDKTIEITDFYVYPSRWGWLAAYAAMEYIKGWSDSMGIPMVTATPTNNGRMIRAFTKVFGKRDPVLVVYRYEPTAPAAGAKPEVLAANGGEI